MRNLVFVEGLWHTGKSHFLNQLQSIRQPENENLRITTDIRDLGTIRHAAYSLYPEVYPNFDLVFDRSPVTLKSISNPNLGIYDNYYVNSSYWEEFYNQWVSEMSSLIEEDNRILFIYFKPFTKELKISNEIVNYIKNYDKSFLMVDKNLITEQKLIELHHIFMVELLNLHHIFKDKFKRYFVEYRDTESALNIMKQENLIGEIKS